MGEATVDRARRDYDRARAAAEAATPGGLHGDPATLSGVRRKPNRRADARRFAVYDRQAAAARRLAAAERDAERLVRQAVRAERDNNAHRDLDSLRPGDAVRTRHGWHKVVRVSAKSVTVETEHSWTDRIPMAKVIETRAVNP